MWLRTSKHLFTLIALVLAACLSVGCSSQSVYDPADATGFSAEANEDQKSPDAQPDESKSVSESFATSGERADLGSDDQIAAISKSWQAFAVLYDGEIYPFSKYPTFEDLYDNTYITIYENGRFAYQSSAVYTYRGSWHFHEDYDGVLTYVLRTDSVAKVTPESGLGGEEIGSGDGKVFIVYIFGDKPFLVVTENGDDLNETPTPAFVATDVWQVPMEPSVSDKGTSDGSAQKEKPVDSSPSQNGSKNSTSATPAPSAPSHTATRGELRALEQAKAYLDLMGFSREGLIDQLEYEGFSHSEAVYGADHAGADWNEQAVRKAREYLEIFPMSYDELVDQLEYEGFTHSEAVYGASNA